MKHHWWWPFYGREGGGWRCGARHPIYDDDVCLRKRFHRGSHLHPDTGWWVDDDTRHA